MEFRLQPRVWIPLSHSQFDSYIWGLDFGLGLGLRLFNIIKSNLGFLMTSLLSSVLEMLCLSGNVLSGIIAFNVWRIQEKSFINRMFFLYFLIDCVIGATDPYFLFKIFRERSVLLWSVTSILHILFVRYDGELQQEQNCKLFLATWMLWALQRGIYNTAMMGIR